MNSLLTLSVVAFLVGFLVGSLNSRRHDTGTEYLQLSPAVTPDEANALAERVGKSH